MESEISALSLRIAERNARLQVIAGELKDELFGIDTVIDRVIGSIRAWFVLPEIIHRPVIVCLWGLTGTGKTQLTRSLAQKLGFYNRFVEVQMDGFSNGVGYGTDSISGMLGESGIEEGAPGILVLDEFQRYRTVDPDGDDAKVHRYVDVWTLLSDGRLPPSLSLLSELEMSLAKAEYRVDREGPKSGEQIYDFDAFLEGQGKARDDQGRFTLSPYTAGELKKTLKLKEPIIEIMAMTADEIHRRMREFRSEHVSWETDYSKLLVFVCGNLDELYQEAAKRVEDCDTDADIFHAVTQKLSVIDVKRALTQRFKPEQIARLGNNHVIYPSFDRSTFKRLIVATCQRYLDEIQKSSKQRFSVSEELHEEIYLNAVFPSQGTRPLFSSIHAVLSSSLVNFTLWALENGIGPDQELRITVDCARKHLVVQHGNISTQCEVRFELNPLRKRTQPDFRALLAVHEAGHALVYALLFRQAPRQVKINAATFGGGYNIYPALQAESERNVLDQMCAVLAGRAAELMVFGQGSLSIGSESDLAAATKAAAMYVRRCGLAGRLSRTDVATRSGEDINTDVSATNAWIEELLQKQYSRAQEILAGQVPVFLRMVRALTDNGEITADELSLWLGLPLPGEQDQVGAEGAVGEPYARKLRLFCHQWPDRLAA